MVLLMHSEGYDGRWLVLGLLVLYRRKAVALYFGRQWRCLCGACVGEGMQFYYFDLLLYTMAGKWEEAAVAGSTTTTINAT